MSPPSTSARRRCAKCGRPPPAASWTATAGTWPRSCTGSGASAAGQDDRRRLDGYLRRIVPGIQGARRRVLGGAETVEFAQDVPGSAHPWRFTAPSVSDGTLRALGVLVALFAPTGSGYGVVAVEEPETALHPTATAVAAGGAAGRRRPAPGDRDQPQPRPARPRGRRPGRAARGPRRPGQERHRRPPTRRAPSPCGLNCAPRATCCAPTSSSPVPPRRAAARLVAAPPVAVGRARRGPAPRRARRRTGRRFARIRGHGRLVTVRACPPPPRVIPCPAPAGRTKSPVRTGS